MSINNSLKEEKDKGMSIDEATLWLCMSEQSKTASIASIANVYSISIAEAKTLVRSHERDCGEELVTRLLNRPYRLWRN